MSAALLRQSLELVDSEGSLVGRKKKRDVKRSVGQVAKKNLYKKTKKYRPVDAVASEKRVEENVRRLQQLSTPTLDKAITDKILKSAARRTASEDKIEVPANDNKPVLFTEESFKQFEKELFCS